MQLWGYHLQPGLLEWCSGFGIVQGTVYTAVFGGLGSHSCGCPEWNAGPASPSLLLCLQATLSWLSGKFFQFCFSCVWPLCSHLNINHPWLMPADWEQEVKVNSSFSEWSQLVGEVEQTGEEILGRENIEAVFGNGERELGCEEGGERCRHSGAQAKNQSIVGQEVLCCIVTQPCSKESLIHQGLEEPSLIGMELEWFGCRAGLSGYPGFFYLWAPV